MQAGTGADTLNTTTSEGQMQPGRSYIPDVVMVSYTHWGTSYIVRYPVRVTL